MPSIPRSQPVCPVCSGNLFRVKRRLIDKLLHPLRPVRRYKCEMCNQLCNLKAAPTDPALLQQNNGPPLAR